MPRVLKLLIVLGVVLTVPFASASALSVRGTPPTPVERLQQQTGGQAEILWDQATGVPVFIAAESARARSGSRRFRDAGPIVLRRLW